MVKNHPRKLPRKRIRPLAGSECEDFLLLGTPEPVSVVYVLTQAVGVGMAEDAHVRVETGLERQFAYLSAFVGANGLL